MANVALRPNNMARRTRSGYVYVMTNPALPGWSKVGRTQRPPHRRARELSSAGIPEAYHVAFARFFWDCYRGERMVHQVLHDLGGHGSKRKEFFNVPVDDIVRSVLQAPNQPQAAGPDRSSTASLDEDEPWESPDWDADWANTPEGLQARWEWAEETWARGDAFSRADAWAAMEKLSAEGWGEATWRLAAWIVTLRPTIEGAEQASWVFEAAQDQGVPGGRLRAAWLRSWSLLDGLQAWYVALHHAWETYGAQAPLDWPWHVVETLEAEVACWEHHPQRRHDHPWWPALVERWTMEKTLAGPAWPAPREALLKRLQELTARSHWGRSAA